MYGDYSYQIYQQLQTLNAKADSIINKLDSLLANSGTISANSSDSLTLFQWLQTSLSDFFAHFNWQFFYSALAFFMVCATVNTFLKRGWLN